MTPKPWERTDDDLGDTTSGPCGADTNDLAADMSAPAMDVANDDLDFDDPFAEPGDVPAGPPTVDDMPSEMSSEMSSDVADDAPCFDDPSPTVVAPAQEQPQDAARPEESAALIHDGAGAGGSADSGQVPADSAPQPRRNPDFDDDDPDDWDDIVPAAQSAATDGYVISAPQPIPIDLPPQAPKRTPPAKDGELAVTLTRSTPEEADAEAERRRIENARRNRPNPSQRQLRRPDKVAAAAKKKTLTGRVKTAFGTDEGTLRAERAASRTAVRPVTVLVLGEKGGVGKTTVATTVAMTMATVRSERVVAVDATPSGGTLGSRCPKDGRGTARSLIDQLEYVDTYAHVREHTAQGPTGLEVLGADPAQPQELIQAEEYEDLMETLRTHYNLLIVDGPSALLSMDMDYQRQLLFETDVLVLVTEGTEGVQEAVKLYNALRRRTYGDSRLNVLLDTMIMVANTREKITRSNVKSVMKYISQELTPRVIEWPFDPLLEGGGEIKLESLSQKTRSAAMALAAQIASAPGFTGT